MENKNNSAKQPKNTSQITRDYLDSILIEERLVDSQVASLKMELFGEIFDTPIMMPAFSHLNKFVKEQENAMCAYAKAAKNLGAVNWIGMCENDEFKEFAAVCGRTVRIIKPYADRDKILDQITFAKSCGALATGIDIDHIFGEDGDYDNVFGERMARQTVSDLREYASLTDLPFIVKGVLSVRDAVKCAEAGASALLISHHHGRMPFAIPPLMVLPEIKKVLGPSSGIRLMVDCGIDSGIDAFKALALGADAVAVGRAMMPALIKDGSDGVEAFVRKMNEELAMMMNYTGCANLQQMDPSVLWINGKPCR